MPFVAYAKTGKIATITGIANKWLKSKLKSLRKQWYEKEILLKKFRSKYRY